MIYKHLFALIPLSIMMAPNMQVQSDVQSVLKITLADGSDALGHFSQNSIGNSIIETNITDSGDYLIEGTGSFVKEKINIGPNFTGSVTIKNLYLQYGTDFEAESPFSIDPSSNVTLYLSGENYISSSQYFPAISIYGSEPATGSLTIDSKENGSLTATTFGSGAAAIGGRGMPGNDIYVGDITIKGGNITARNSSVGGAAIGGGEKSQIDNITIEGGTINAFSYGNKSFAGAAIGSGSDGSIENITITGGNITASTYSESGQSSVAAAIGSGAYSSIKEINISGGNISATSSLGAAIGCGLNYRVSDAIDHIKIDGGIINTYNAVNDSLASIGVSDNSNNTLTSMIINGGSIKCDKFTTAPVNDEDENLYQLSLKLNNTSFSDILYNGQSLNIASQNELEDNLYLYLPGQDAELIVKGEEEKQYSIVFDEGTQTLSIEDDVQSIPSTKLNAVPVITASDINIPLGSSFTEADALKNVTAYDEEEGYISEKVTADISKVNLSMVGDYPVTYSVTDNQGAKATKQVTATVYKEEINHAPTISAEDIRIPLHSSFTEADALKNVTAYDEEEGYISERITVDISKVNTNQIGDYIITYKVKDNQGLEASKQVTVTVYEEAVNHAPIINATDIRIPLHSSFTEADALKNVTAYDEEEGYISDRITVDVSKVNTDQIGDYSITYKVKDNQGLETVKEVTVTVYQEIVVNEYPTIECHDFSIEEGSSLTDKEIIKLANVKAEDKEDGPLTDKIIVSRNNLDLNNPGTYKITFTVEDNNHQEAKAECTVTVTKKIVSNVPTKDDNTTIIIICSSIGIIVIAGIVISIFIYNKRNKSKR